VPFCVGLTAMNSRFIVCIARFARECFFCATSRTADINKELIQMIFLCAELDD